MVPVLKLNYRYFIGIQRSHREAKSEHNYGGSASTDCCWSLVCPGNATFVTIFPVFERYLVLKKYRDAIQVIVQIQRPHVLFHVSLNFLSLNLNDIVGDVNGQTMFTLRTNTV
jgi:hypothetical protein